jgi:transcriptional regulator with AAA-type ATPase domain
MQLIIFLKKLSDKPSPVLMEWETDKNRILPDEIRNQGTICLVSLSAFESVHSQIDKAGYCDCGVKAEKIDLKRALRFDEKRDRSKPKYLFFNSISPGGFKRGLTAFYEKHYTMDDPPCIIIIKDEIFNTIAREGVIKSKDKVSAAAIDEKDPLYLLINIPEANPLINKLEGIYIGNSLAVRYTRAMIYRACQTDSPVLILGESGTGKDVIAAQIFENATSYKKGFYRVNCSALPETLFEGELFGYVKGSYTGATSDKAGIFIAAENGTIFLDEIGDLSPANQVKILHAVENHEIRQIGSNKSRLVNVRIIAATNRNLEAMMKQGTFREDLYYRISTFMINASPLREHPEDIPNLANAYWARKHRTTKLSNEFLEYLKTYLWPGNVRELYSTLNSVVDYYGNVSPMPSHIDGIRKLRQNVLNKAKTRENDDPAQFMKIKSQNVLISIQNILRSIKIVMRPVIYGQAGTINKTAKQGNLKEFFREQADKLNDLCSEPSYFKRWEVFKKTAKYRYVLEKTTHDWPVSVEELRSVWTNDLEKLDDEINRGIMEMMWGKTDM